MDQTSPYLRAQISGPSLFQGKSKEQVRNTQSDKIAAELQAARDYNRELKDSVYVMADPFDPEAAAGNAVSGYSEILNITSDGIMGYLDIPRIGVYLPIYHTTEEEVLQKGIGHLEQSTLPVGGTGCHSILSGHTGLSTAKMLTDLNRVNKGDIFLIHVFDLDLPYEVDRISIVEPYDTTELCIDPELDLVTLVTCYPYGVNGVPMSDKAYTYDAAQGELELAMSSAMVESVSINVEEESLIAKASKLFKPMTAKALTSYDEMIPLVSNIKLPAWVVTGTLFTGKAPYAYTGLGTDEDYPNHTYAYVNDGAQYTVDALIDELDDIIYSGGSLNMSKIGELKRGMYLRFSFYKRSAVYTYSGEDIYSELSSASQGNGAAMDWSQFTEKILRLACGHVSTPLLGSYSGAQYVGGKYSLLPCAIRFLKVDRTNEYAIIGILTGATHMGEKIDITLPLELTKKQATRYRIC